jgi:cyanophycinase
MIPQLSPPPLPSRFLVLCLALSLPAQFAVADFGPRPTKPGPLSVWITGDAADRVVQPDGPALLLMGGGSDVTNAFSRFALPAARGGDVVVLRTSGSDGYNDYLYNMVTGTFKPHSVESILLTSRTHADSDYVVWTIDTAEFLWFAGGNQTTHLNAWRDTRTQEALQRAWDRGAIIGGTSAGEAILGEFIFAPTGSAPTGSEAIANPYRSGNNLVDVFIETEVLRSVITDQHFMQRDRMGRPLSWMARLVQDGRAETMRSIAVDERTSMWIDKDNMGTVVGTGQVFVMWETPATQRTQVAPNQPLIYGPVNRVRLLDRQKFDFNTWTGDVAPIPLSVDGTNTDSVFDPDDPYAFYLPPPPADERDIIAIF